MAARTLAVGFSAALELHPANSPVRYKVFGDPLSMPHIVTNPISKPARIAMLSGLLALTSTIGCRRPEPPPPVPEPTPVPVAATPTPAPTPERNLLPEGKFFLKQRISVVTKDGVLGFEPGTDVIEVSPGVYTVDGHPTEISSMKLTNDIDEMEALLAEKAELRKERIRRIREARKRAAEEAKPAAPAVPAAQQPVAPPTPLGIPEPPVVRAVAIQSSVIPETSLPIATPEPTAETPDPNAIPNEKTASRQFQTGNIRYQVKVRGLEVEE